MITVRNVDVGAEHISVADFDLLAEPGRTRLISPPAIVGKRYSKVCCMAERLI